MASQFQSIAALITDDTGTPESPNGDGTQINKALFELIDAILNEILTRSAKTVGGVWTWESAGSHTMSASSASANELFIRNTGLNSGSVTRLRLGNDSDTNLAVLSASSSTASLPNTVSLEARGNLRIGVGVTATTEIYGVGGIKARFPNNGMDVLALAGDNIGITATIHNTAGGGLGDNSGLLLGGNIGTWNTATGSSFGTQSNVTFPSWAIDLGGARGNDGAPWQIDSFAVMRRAAAGTWAKMMHLSTTSSAPQLIIGRSAIGQPGEVQIGEGSGSPVSGQILFGGDGSGWQLRIGRNNAGTITHYWALTDTGHLVPVNDQVYNIGAGGSRVGTIATVNLSSVNVNAEAIGVGSGGLLPATDNSAPLGDATHRFSALYVVDARFNDVSFANDWSITEGEYIGLGPGLAFLRPDQELCAFLDDRGILYVDEVRELNSIRAKFVKKTRAERNASKI
jgi:hypothetical protein